MTVSFHAGILPHQNVNDCVELGVTAEKLGFDGIWVADSHSVFRDAFAVLNLVASKTTKLKLATGVTHVVTRHPAVLANQFATLHEVSNGREIIGIGVGESSVRNLGLKPDKLANLEKKIEVIRSLIGGDKTHYLDTEIQMPWSSYKSPIFMACSGPKSLQMGGRIADGVLFQVGADPAFHRYAIENIRIGAEQAGRKLEDIKLYARIACAVSCDKKAAQQEVKGYCSVAAGTVFKTVPREYFNDALYQQLTDFKDGYSYNQHGYNDADHRSGLTDDIINAIAFAGTPEEILPRFQKLIDMGVEGFVCPFSMKDASTYMAYFSKEIINKINK